MRWRVAAEARSRCRRATSPSRCRRAPTPASSSRSTVPCSSTPARMRASTYSALRCSRMTVSMPAFASSAPSSRPDGPAPTIATWVVVFIARNDSASALQRTPYASPSRTPHATTMIDKIVLLGRRRLADVRTARSVMIGGFGDAGMPTELIDALIEQGRERARRSSTTTPATATSAWRRCSRPGGCARSSARSRGGRHRISTSCTAPAEIELELVPQGTLAERMRAAGAGIGAFFTPTGYGTAARRGQGDARDRRPRLRARVSDPRRLRADQGRARRPLGQPHVPHDGAQLRADHGDARRRRPSCRCGRSSSSARSTRSRSSRPASSSTESWRSPARRTRPRRSVGGTGTHDDTAPATRSRARVAQDIPGRCVRQPRHRPADAGRNHLPKDREIILHSENGMLGMGPAPPARGRGLRPHQRRQAAGDVAAGRLVLRPRRLASA